MSRRVVAGEDRTRHLTKQRHRNVHPLPRQVIGAGKEVAPAQGQHFLAQQEALPADRLQEQRAQTTSDFADGCTTITVAETVFEYQRLDHPHVVVEFHDRLRGGVPVRTAKTQCDGGRAA